MQTLSQYIERHAHKAIGFTVAPAKGRKAPAGAVTVYLYTHAVDWGFDRRHGYIGGSVAQTTVTDDGAASSLIHRVNC